MTLSWNRTEFFWYVYMNFNKLLRFIIKFYFQNIETINRLLWRCIRAAVSAEIKRGNNTSTSLTLYVGCRKRLMQSIKTNAIKFWLALGIDILL